MRGCVFVGIPRLFPAFPGRAVLCGRGCWAPVSAVPRLSWSSCRGEFCLFLFRLLAVPVPGLVVPVPPSPLFRDGLLVLFFFLRGVCLCVLGAPFSSGPLFLAWWCQFWLGGYSVPLWGSCLRCLLGGGFGHLLWCWRAVWWLWAVLLPPPLPPLFFLGGGSACSPLCLRGLAHALARIQCGLPGCCWWLRSIWPCSGPMGRVGYVHVRLGAPPCRVRSWLCRLGGHARRLRVALG